jgi:hypothetical protein
MLKKISSPGNAACLFDFLPRSGADLDLTVERTFILARLFGPDACRSTGVRFHVEPPVARENSVDDATGIRAVAEEAPQTQVHLPHANGPKHIMHTRTLNASRAAAAEQTFKIP